MAPFWESSKYIDSDHPEVTRKAREWARGCADAEAVARNCFLFVRDEIRHSWDWRQNPVTCTASGTLRHGTGFCCAQSRLLAALLRACGIPAGLCSQRLQVDPGGERTCLHGLNAVLLPGWVGAGWMRAATRRALTPACSRPRSGWPLRSIPAKLICPASGRNLWKLCNPHPHRVRHGGRGVCPSAGP